MLELLKSFKRAGAQPVITGPQLILEKRPGPDGRSALHFPFMSISDVHWGSKMSRAKRLCMMLANTVTDRLEAIGDIIDGEALIKKAEWNMGPYQRQGLAWLLQKVASGTIVRDYIGNHEHGLEVSGNVVKYDPENGGTLEAVQSKPHRNLIGKFLFGIEILEKAHYKDPKGRTFRIEHGHLHDDHLFKTAEIRNRWYRIGNFFNEAFASLDDIVHRRTRFENFSSAARVKKSFKGSINERLGIRKAMEKNVDHDKDIQGVIYGHSHMASFQRTKKGKTLINDGSSTDHVQAVVHDKNGTWAILTWHKNSLEIEQEDGQKYTKTWAELGLDHFSEEPALIEDEHTKNADRILRLIYRMWPPKDRQDALKEIRIQRATAEDVEKKIQVNSSVSLRDHFVRETRKLDELYQSFANNFRRIPLPHHHTRRDTAAAFQNEMA